MSASNPGCIGAQSSHARVRSLVAGASIPANIANQPKCSPACAPDFDTTGTFSRRPITAAISRNGTPVTGVRYAQPNRERVARFAVGAFRADIARGGATQSVQAFVDEMRATSAEFDAMWRDHDIHSHDEGTKEIRHPQAGRIALEYSAFSVTGRPDLNLVIFTPATPADRARIRALVAAREQAREPAREPHAPAA